MDFNSVDRYEVKTGFLSYSVEEKEDGHFVVYDDYKELLDAYNDLKFILEGLEK